MSGKKIAVEKKPEPGDSFESSIGLDKGTIKRVFYGTNIVFIGAAFLILLIMFFVAWGFVDDIEKLATESAQNTCTTLIATESALIHVEEELALVSGTASGLDDSLTSLSTGLDEAAGALRDVESSLSVLSTLGVNLGDEIGNSADSLENASASLTATAGGMDEHQTKISEIQEDISGIRSGIAGHKQTLCNEKEISDIFGSIRLSMIIMFILAAALIFVIFINSAAGIL